METYLTVKSAYKEKKKKESNPIQSNPIPHTLPLTQTKIYIFLFVTVFSPVDITAERKMENTHANFENCCHNKKIQNPHPLSRERAAVTCSCMALYIYIYVI